MRLTRRALIRRLHVLLRGLVEGSGLGLRSVDVGEEVEAEADLGDQVSDGDDANLLREAERARALGADDPDDGVDKPHKDGKSGQTQIVQINEPITSDLQHGVQISVKM